MKRFLCALFCLVLLCGCSGSIKTVTPVLSGISFTAKVSFYNEYYECETVIDTDGAMRISVLSPADISGMRLIFSNDSVTAEYMGLTYTPKTESLPVGSVAQTFYGIIKDLSAKETIPIKANENCIYEGRINERAYSFCFAPSGLPLYIEIPDNSFRIDFSGVKIL